MATIRIFQSKKELEKLEIVRYTVKTVKDELNDLTPSFRDAMLYRLGAQLVLDKQVQGNGFNFFGGVD